MSVPPDVLENFELAFRSSGAGCYRQCACGAEFFNPGGGWEWGEGELEGLEKGSATARDWSIGTLFIEGKEYCLDCDCWHSKAERVIRFINGHGESIARFLTMEKARRLREANAAPVVEETKK